MESKNPRSLIVRLGDRNVECDVLVEFDCEENGKTYLGYTDNSIDAKGKKNLFFSSFDPIFGIGLEPVTTKEEWDMINDVIEKIRKDDPSVTNCEIIK